MTDPIADIEDDVEDMEFAGLYEQVEAYVEDRPLKALAIAFVTGAVLSRLLF